MLRLLRPSRRAASTASWSGPALLGTPRAKASRRFCELNNVDIAETAEAEAEPESPDEDVSEARAAPSFTPFTDGDGVRTQGRSAFLSALAKGLEYSRVLVDNGRRHWLCWNSAMWRMHTSRPTNLPHPSSWDGRASGSYCTSEIQKHPILQHLSTLE